MALRTDLPRIKPNTLPSIFNHDMSVGAFLGGLTASVLVLAIMGVPATGAALGGYLMASLTGDLVGGVLGGLKGKAKQQKDQIEGRVVKEPGYLNKGIFTGYMLASLPQTLLLGTTGAMLNPIISIPLTLGAMVMGSVARNSELQREFNQAVAVREAQMQDMTRGFGLGRSRGLQSPAISYAHSVTPEEAATLAEKQRTAPAQQTYAEQIQQSRAQLADNNLARSA